MCEQCSAATKTYGEVVPHWRLVQATKDGNMMKADDFGLVWCDDPSYFWPGDMRPRKDPAFEMPDADFDNMNEEAGDEWDSFIEYVDKLAGHFQSDPTTGHGLVTACHDAGYSRQKHGFRLLSWLSHRMAATMERNPTADENLAEEYAAQDHVAWGYKRNDLGDLIKERQSG